MSAADDAEACPVCDGTGKLLGDICPLCDGLCAGSAAEAQEEAAEEDPPPMRKEPSNSICLAADGLRCLLKDMFVSHQEAFAKACSSDSTRLSREDLHRFVRTEMGDDNTAHADQLFDRIDVNGDGHISQEEFATFFKGEIAKPKPDFAVLGFKERLRVTFQSYHEAFSALEFNDDGVISREELHNYISKLGDDNRKFADRVFDEIDNDGDGRITQFEFKKFFQDGFRGRRQPRRQSAPGALLPNRTGSSIVDVTESPQSSKVVEMDLTGEGYVVREAPPVVSLTTPPESMDITIDLTAHRPD